MKSRVILVETDEEAVHKLRRELLKATKHKRILDEQKIVHSGNISQFYVTKKVAELLEEYHRTAEQNTKIGGQNWCFRNRSKIEGHVHR